MRRQGRSTSRDHVVLARGRSRSTSRDPRGSRSRANSLSSDSIMSRESVSEFKLKLSNMESELDATLRSLTGSDIGSHSASEPSALDVQSYASTNVGPTSVISRDSLDGRGILPPKVVPDESKSRSSRAAPRHKISGNPPRTQSEEFREDLREQLETQEKYNRLLDEKYDEQRKRLQASKKENKDMQRTLDAAMAEIGKLREQQQKQRKRQQQLEQNKHLQPAKNNIHASTAPGSAVEGGTGAASSRKGFPRKQLPNAGSTAATATPPPLETAHVEQPQLSAAQRQEAQEAQEEQARRLSVLQQNAAADRSRFKALEKKAAADGAAAHARIEELEGQVLDAAESLRRAKRATAKAEAAAKAASVDARAMSSAADVLAAATTPKAAESDERARAEDVAPEHAQATDADEKVGAQQVADDLPVFTLRKKHVPVAFRVGAALGCFLIYLLVSRSFGAAQVKRLRLEQETCANQLRLRQEDGTLYAGCNKELEREKGVIRSLSQQLRALQTEYAAAIGGGGGGGDEAEINAEGGPSVAPSGWRPSFWPFGDGRSMSTSDTEAVEDEKKGSTFDKSQRMRAFATYTDATAMMEAVLSGEAAEQELHTCKQERGRVVAAQHTTLTELTACEERLLKQDAWAASLAATNQVLNEHLIDATDELGTMQASYVAMQETSSRLESAHATLVQSNESATNTSWTAHRRIADLENMTVTLNSTVVILRGHLKTAHVNIEELSNEKHKLRAEVAAARASNEAAQSAQTTLEDSLASAEGLITNLTTSLAEEKGNVQLRDIAIASESARCAMLAERSEYSTREEMAAKQQLTVCNALVEKGKAELGSAHAQRDQLLQDVQARSERLLELEQVVASLNAAAYIVDGARNRTSSASTSNSPASSTTIGSSGVESCTASVSMDGKERQLCLKVQSPGRHSPGSSSPERLFEDSDFGSERSPLIAIAGAAAAVWVFVVVLSYM